MTDDRYLELLKRSLTGELQHDALVPVRGRRFRSLVRLLDRHGLILTRRRIVSRAYVEEGRPEGALVGETMIGRKRLDSLQSCVEDILDRNVPGDLIEAGVWRGGASILMRAVLSVRDSERRVWLADSFQGLPAPKHRHDDPATYRDFADLGVSRRVVEGNFERFGLLDDQVRFVEGWFKDTLPTVRDHTWALVRIDADMYESTMDALTHLYPGLAPGGYLVVDDYGDLGPCRQAVDDFRSSHNIEEPLEHIDWTGVMWQRRG